MQYTKFIKKFIQRHICVLLTFVMGLVGSPNFHYGIDAVPKVEFDIGQNKVANSTTRY